MTFVSAPAASLFQEHLFHEKARMNRRTTYQMQSQYTVYHLASHHDKKKAKDFFMVVVCVSILTFWEYNSKRSAQKLTKWLLQYAAVMHGRVKFSWP